MTTAVGRANRYAERREEQANRRWKALADERGSRQSIEGCRAEDDSGESRPGGEASDEDERFR